MIAEIRAIEASAGLSPDAETFIDRSPAQGLVAHFAFEDDRSGEAKDAVGGPSASGARRARVDRARRVAFGSRLGVFTPPCRRSSVAWRRSPTLIVLVMWTPLGSNRWWLRSWMC